MGSLPDEGAAAVEKAASLTTLSKHLGLSRAAISRVLNRTPAAEAIPRVTQDRIFAAAAQFNYRPNVLARSLRRGQSMTVGVLVPEISEGYATLVLAGLEQGLLKAGYAFFLCSHHHQPDVVARSQAMLVERAVDGLVAIDTTLIQHGVLPTVTVSCPEEGGPSTNIVLDHQRGATLAVEHLHGLGHRELAVIKGQSFSSDTKPRWLAIRAAAKRLGMHMAAVEALKGDAPTHEPGYLATRRLLEGGTRFTALFAFNDVSAIGAVKALKDAGKRVPEDVSVVGFDDVQSAAFQNPALTTVRQPLHAMGLMAAEEIVLSIGKRHGGTLNLVSGSRVVTPELIVRESTGPIRTLASTHPSQHAPRPARPRSNRQADTLSTRHKAGGLEMANAMQETERMTLTRVFDAPRELLWNVWTDPLYRVQWWGPKGFTSPVCNMDFRVGGKFRCCMKAPDGQEFWNAGEYHQIVPHEKIVSSMYFSDPEGNKVEPPFYGVEHEAIEDAYDVTLFTVLENGQTQLTFVGNESMESAKSSGQLEGWNEIFDKFATLVAKVTQAT